MYSYNLKIADSLVLRSVYNVLLHLILSIIVAGLSFVSWEEMRASYSRGCMLGTDRTVQRDLLRRKPQLSCGFAVGISERDFVLLMFDDLCEKCVVVLPTLDYSQSTHANSDYTWMDSDGESH